MKISGWSLGEHQEWSKYSNFEVAVRVPLMFYIPGVTAPKKQGSTVFPYISPLGYRDLTGVYGMQKNSDMERMVDSFAPVKYFKFQSGRNYKTAAELAELVDIFPTLSVLAGLPAFPLCPKNSSAVILCTEGTSLVPVINRTVMVDKSEIKWKTSVFSQYPRPSDFPAENSDQPKLNDIKIIGYSMRNRTSRYTEWIGFDPLLFRANWSDIHARELYLHESDPFEMNNVAGLKEYGYLVHLLSKKLKQGWRRALPREQDCPSYLEWIDSPLHH